MTLYDTEYNRRLQQRIMEINRRAIDHQRHYYTSIDTQMPHYLGSGYDDDLEAYEGAGKEERPELGYGVESAEKNFQGNYLDTAISTWDKAFLKPAMTQQEQVQYESGGGLVQQDEINAEMNAKGEDKLLTTKKGRGRPKGAKGKIGLAQSPESVAFFAEKLKQEMAKRGLKNEDLKGAGILSSVLGAIGLGKKQLKGSGILSGILGAIGLGKEGGAPPFGTPLDRPRGKGADDFIKAYNSSIFGGKKRGRPKKGGNIGLAQSPESVAYFADKQAKEGGNIFEDIWSGVKDVAGTVAPFLPLLGVGKKKRGRKGKGRSGGAVLPEASSSFGANLEGGCDDCPKDNVQLKGHYGGAKKPNARAEIVRRIMKEKGLKLADASKYVKEHGLYKK